MNVLPFNIAPMQLLTKLIFLAVLGIVVAGFLLLGLCIALLSVLWSLVRGKKPAMFTVFQHFRQASAQFGQARWARPTTHANAANADIVDVQAHEVHTPVAVLNGSQAPNKGE